MCDVCFHTIRCQVLSLSHFIVSSNIRGLLILPPPVEILPCSVLCDVHRVYSPFSVLLSRVVLFFMVTLFE